MPIIFYPHHRHLIKQWVGILISVPLQLAFFGFFIANILGVKLSGIINVSVLIFVLPSTLFSLVISYLVYRSIRYEITEDEIIVYSGVLNKHIKHVPFRTVTNMQVIRGFWDRIFGLGVLEIQTAGTGTLKAEESLIGLEDVQGVYEYVAKVLRTLRSGISPTQTMPENLTEKKSTSERELLVLILNELRTIRKEIRQSNSVQPSVGNR